MNFTFDDLARIWGTSVGGVNISEHPFFLLDILLVSVIFYYLYIWSQKTRIVPIISGLFILALFFLASRIFDLEALEWVLDKTLTMMVIAIPIVFSDEIKKFLERIGRTNFSKKFSANDEIQDWIREISTYIEKAKKERIGSLIVFERNSLLSEYLESGTMLNADINADLFYSIFQTESPLHDGAVIIRNGKLAAAGCILPISRENFKNIGTRHRAAIELSNKSDALVIVVSEENGKISIAENGELKRDLNIEQLKNISYQKLKIKIKEKESLFQKIKKMIYVK